MVTYSWLNGNHGPGRQMASDAEILEHVILVFVVGVAAGVVGIHSEVMTKS